MQNLGEIWVVGKDGKNPYRIPVEERQVNDAFLSPDGKHVGFIASDPDVLKRTKTLSVMDRTGTSVQELVSIDGDAWDPMYSPDGRWISYCARLYADSPDSIGVYFLDTQNPGVPRLIKGLIWNLGWLSPSTFIGGSRNGSYIVSLNGSERRQYFEDSTWARPLLHKNYILYADLRHGREGVWIVPSNPEKTERGGKPRRVLPEGWLRGWVREPEGRYVVYWDLNFEIKIVYLPECRTERLEGIGGNRLIQKLRVRQGGEEMTYIANRDTGKLVLLDKLHK